MCIIKAYVDMNKLRNQFHWDVTSFMVLLANTAVLTFFCESCLYKYVKTSFLVIFISIDLSE